MVGWVCRLNTMDWGMEQMTAMDQATISIQRVRSTEGLWEIGNAIALNLKKRILESWQKLAKSKNMEIGCVKV
jgi:hypothetical protein